ARTLPAAHPSKQGRVAADQPVSDGRGSREAVEKTDRAGDQEDAGRGSRQPDSVTEQALPTQRSSPPCDKESDSAPWLERTAQVLSSGFLYRTPTSTDELLA